MKWTWILSICIKHHKAKAQGEVVQHSVCSWNQSFPPARQTMKDSRWFKDSSNWLHLFISLRQFKQLRVRGVTCPKIYELTPPHGTLLTPRPQELTPCANHHGTPALTDRFLDWFVIFLRDLVHFTSVREFFDLTPNVKERMAHLQIVFYQPKFSDVIPIVGTTYLISKNVIHDGFPHWHTEYIQVLR